MREVDNDHRRDKYEEPAIQGLMLRNLKLAYDTTFGNNSRRITKLNKNCYSIEHKPLDVEGSSNV